ncbi:MAG TPA: hypothetical protein ENK23_07430, partial [Sorangium sp.]|nr:hypothetical protein [Sorangium sp.]
MTNAELEARAAALVAAGDVVGAALLWQQHGEHLTAAALFERACAFDDAARAALAADKDDALRLALLGGNQDLIQEVSASLQRMRTPAQFCDIAQAQLTCGFSRQAGRMFEA